jgi:hypothetical protein
MVVVLSFFILMNVLIAKMSDFRNIYHANEFESFECLAASFLADVILVT